MIYSMAPTTIELPLQDGVLRSTPAWMIDNMPLKHVGPFHDRNFHDHKMWILTTKICKATDL